MNNYKWSISSGETVQYKSLKSIVYMSIFLAVIMGALKDFIPAFTLVIIAIVVAALRKNQLVTYEYVIEEGQVSIFKKLSNKDGKQVFLFNLQDIIVMAPEISQEIKKIEGVTSQSKEYFPKNLRKGIYTVILKRDNEKLKLKFIPDEKALALLEKEISIKLKKS